MEALGAMAMTMYEQVAEQTRPVEAAFYELLDRLDEYSELLARLLAELEAETEPNKPLIKRFRSFGSKAANMTQILEDEVLTEMLTLLDRLHAVKDAEEGTFI